MPAQRRSKTPRMIPYQLRTARERTQRAQGSPSPREPHRRKTQAKKKAPKRQITPKPAQQQPGPSESEAEQRRRAAEEEAARQREEERRAQSEERRRAESEEQQRRRWELMEEDWAAEEELRAAASRQRQERQEQEETERRRRLIDDAVVERSLKIFVNKRLIKQKKLPDLAKAAFDLAEISEALDIELRNMPDGELYNLEDIKIFAKSLVNRTVFERHDANDFGAEDNQIVHGMLDAARIKHPQSKLSIIVEARGSINRRTPAMPLPLTSSPAPSTPQTAGRRKTATTARQEQMQARLEKIELAGDFERQLVNQWECREKGCVNHMVGYCYIDPRDSKLHYNLKAEHMKSWSQAIRDGEATLTTAPIKLLDYWRQEQGPIQRESKAPIRRTFQQKTEAGMTTLSEQIEQSRLENLLREEKTEARRQREKEEREEEQRRREQRIQQREEEQQRREDVRRQREDEDRDEERRRRREDQELQRQRKHEEEEWRRQLTLLQCQQHMPQQTALTTPSQQSIPPYFSLNPPLFGPVRPLPHQPAVQTDASETRSSKVDPSSPISSEADDETVLDDFFQWKIDRQQREERKKVWGRIWDVVLDNGWSIADLKAMGAGKMYERAVAAGIPDGIARHFGDELRSYKRYRRE